MSGGKNEERPPLGTGGAQEKNGGDRVPCRNTSNIPGIDGAGEGEGLLPSKEAVREALRLIHPEGPWHVSAKREKGFTGRVYAPDAEGGAAGWAVAQNRTLNAYVSIAALRVGWQGDKATKEDVGSVGWLWVDLDPRPGEELEPERARILALLTDKLPKGVTGEDRVSVNRKHRSAMEVTLRARFVVMTNEVPKFADRSGALVSRFIVLPMRQSFFGREDSGLTPALMAELPGILNWAVEGWRRVRAQGRITQPKAGRDVALQMTDLASPIPAFVREWCEVGGYHRVAKDHLFSAFRAWHRDRIGHDFVGSSPTWANMLYSAMVAYGFYNVAAQMTARDQGMVH